MAFKKLAIFVGLFVIFTAGAFTAMQVADIGQDNAPAEQKNVTNETLVQEYDAYQYVDKALVQYTAGFDENVTVYNNTSVELTEGEDYEWNESDGTIRYHDTAKTNETNQSTISYTYYENTKDVKELSGPIRSLVEGLGLLPLMVGGIALCLFLIYIGGFIASKFTNGTMESNR